ncbi:MAG TPA: NAD(P)-binding domain-containing protein [Gammaproteobacteria bacterium]|nr:NAD(P)-binding domain-containing protein [Gammaproteobacteria bacterium]
MTLKLVAIGGLGNMLGPSAQHLQNSEVARYLRILDRGTKGARRDKFRQAWKEQGAELVPDMNTLLDDGDFDGVVICAGKNGDDFQILTELVPMLHARATGRDYFILHLSTVSCEFVTATQRYCVAYDMQYVNYPLTGGAKGAAAATMLILCSGDNNLYMRLEPMLQLMGKPNYFGAEVDLGAAVKLMGHVMVFHALLGVSLAVTLHKHVVDSPELGSSQLAMFDFLNNGAGGCRQWEFPVRHGIAENDWQHGFLLQHAVIDVLYAARLLQQKQLPDLLILPLLQTALLFSYLLNANPGKELATQAITQLLATSPKASIDNYLSKYLSLNVDDSFNHCVTSLPEAIQRTLMLDVVYK